MVAHDLAAVRARGSPTRASVIACEPPAGERPADEVAEGAEQQADAGGQRAVERQDGVGGEAGEQRPRRVGRRTGARATASPGGCR